MKRVFNNYFEQIDNLLHVPAFFDPRYKKRAYGNMAMANYESSTPTSEDGTIEDL